MIWFSKRTKQQDYGKEITRAPFLVLLRMGIFGATHRCGGSVNGLSDFDIS